MTQPLQIPDRYGNLAPATCYFCGEPAVGFVNVANAEHWSVPSRFEPACDQHMAYLAALPSKATIVSCDARLRV